MKALRMQIQRGTCNEHFALNLVNLSAAIVDRPGLTLNDASDVARRFGFAAYIGANHVAVHVATAHGEIDPAIPERFAIIS